MAEMPNLSKTDLLERVLQAIRESGWEVQYQDEMPHPLEITIANGEEQDNLRVYIWNITHGAKQEAKRNTVFKSQA